MTKPENRRAGGEPKERVLIGRLRTATRQRIVILGVLVGLLQGRVTAALRIDKRRTR